MRDGSGKVVAEGKTRDDRFDGNDHLEAVLKRGVRYKVEVAIQNALLAADIEPKKAEELFTFHMSGAEPRLPKWLAPTEAEIKFAQTPDGQQVLAAMTKYFATPPDKRADVPLDPKFDPLVLSQSSAVRKLAWTAYAQGVEAAALIADVRQNKITYQEYTSPFVVRTVGTMPADGWPLFIAMHGGGGAPKEVNDQQWQHMQIYYRDQQQVGGYLYLAIRAPNDRWNGFYDSYNLPLTENLIRAFVLAAGVNPNKVFLMGYSHGGYGAFYIGPQIADRFAAIHASAAAPSTGHEVFKNLRNTRFTFMVGEKDSAYGRYTRCVDFDKYMNGLRGDRKDIYPVTFELIKGAPHSGLPDRHKIRDMIGAVRTPVPREVTWHTSFDSVKAMNWLHVAKPSGNWDLTATCLDNNLTIVSPKLDAVDVYLDERLVDYAKPLTIDACGQKSEQKLTPSLRTLCETLAERGDPELMFATRLKLTIPPRPAP